MMKREKIPEWTEKDVRMVAAEVEADPRTVRKVIAGRPVRGMVADRIKRALREYRKVA